MIFLFRLPLEIAFNTISLQTSALAFTYFVRIVSSLLAIVLSFCLFLINILDFSMAFFYPKLRTLLYTIKKTDNTKFCIISFLIKEQPFLDLYSSVQKFPGFFMIEVRNHPVEQVNKFTTSPLAFFLHGSDCICKMLEFVFIVINFILYYTK